MADKYIITAIVSVSLWMATQWVRIYRDYRQRRSERRNLVRALYSEIDFNTKDLLFFVEKSVGLKELKAEFHKNPALIPHITDAHHTLVYTNNISKLHHINDRLITRLVLFYGLLDKIKAQIDGLNQPSYSTISASGKHKTLCSLLNNASEAEKIGCDILERFNKEYRQYELSRQFRLLNE